jgi:hypothetical protein
MAKTGNAESKSITAMTFVSLDTSSSVVCEPAGDLTASVSAARDAAHAGERY